MEHAAFSFHTATNLALPFDSVKDNFVWANYARNAAYQRHQFCVLRGHNHKHKDLYHHREILITSPWDCGKTWKYIRKLVEEADDLDRFRNRIENTVIDSMDLAEDSKSERKIQLQGYNRRQEQGKIVAEVQDNDLTNIGMYDLTFDRTNQWALDFIGLHGEHELKEPVRTSLVQEVMRVPVQGKAIKIEQSKTQPPVNITTPRGSIRRRKNSSWPAEKAPYDPVIEQWYTDPYNRHDPERPTGIKLRKEVLTTALRNRGFRGTRIVNVVNWLVRCNGRHRDYNELVGSNRRKTRHGFQRRHTKGKRKLGTPKDRVMDKPTSLTSSIPTKNHAGKGDGKRTDKSKEMHSDILASGTLAYPSPISMNDDLRINNSTDDEEDTTTNEVNHPTPPLMAIATNEDEDDITETVNSDSESLSPAQEAALQNLAQQITSFRPAFHSTHLPGTQAYKDDYDDWRLEDLKRTQSFWNIVYGNDLDEVAKDKDKNKNKNKNKNGNTSKAGADSIGTKEEDDVKFTYFRDPEGVPRVDVQYRTQGLKPVERVVLHESRREVWTEDRSFGLYVPEKHERLGDSG